MELKSRHCSHPSFTPVSDVGVGTPVARGPRLRTGRALLTHPAPTSGNDGQSLIWPRVCYPRFFTDFALDEANQTLMVYGVEETTDVCIKHPAYLFPGETDV